jgi:metal-responsive CopG/Arc/MetJ family transcriptional regulator
MNNKNPMKRTNVFLPEDLIAAITSIAKEEGCSFAEALRNVAQVGLLARQDANTHKTRMFTLIETLEVGFKSLDQRVSALEANGPPVHD